MVHATWIGLMFLACLAAQQTLSWVIQDACLKRVDSFVEGWQVGFGSC